MTSTRTACARKTGCEGTFQTASDSGHDPNANIFTVDRRDATPTRATAPRGAADRPGRVVLHTRRKRAEYFNGTGRVAGSTAARRSGRAGGGHARTPAAATTSAFIENGDYISFNPDELRGPHARSTSAWPRAARAARSSCGSTRRPARRSPRAERRPDRRLAELDDGLDAARQPRRRARTRCSSCSRHPTRPGGLLNLNWFQVHGKGAAVTAPPEVTATATPDDRRRRRSNVAFNAHGDRPRGRGADLPVGLRRHRHQRPTPRRRRTRPTRTSTPAPTRRRSR